MTAEPINPLDAPQRIQAPAPTRDTSNDTLTFCWDYWTTGDDGQPEVVYDDHLLTAHRPKQAVLLAAITALADLDDGDDETFDPAIAHALQNFVSTVLDEPSAGYVQERLEDPADGRDIDPDLQALVTSLVGRWYGGRSPKAPGGSQRPRSTTGKRSTARSRSTQSTRKR